MTPQRLTTVSARQKRVGARVAFMSIEGLKATTAVLRRGAEIRYTSAGTNHGEHDVVQRATAPVKLGKGCLLLPLNVPDGLDEPVRRGNNGTEGLDVWRQVGDIGSHHTGGCRRSGRRGTGALRLTYCERTRGHRRRRRSQLGAQLGLEAGKGSLVVRDVTRRPSTPIAGRSREPPKVPSARRGTYRQRQNLPCTFL